MKSYENLKAARCLFDALETEFRPLRASLHEAPVSVVDLALKFEVQPGLPFPVIVSLQGDELCLGVGEAFWCEWFPCNKAAVVAQFADVVRGVLSGDIRLVESHCRGRAIKAELQRKVGSSWRTVAAWTKAHWPSFAPTETRVLQKAPAANS